MRIDQYNKLVRDHTPEIVRHQGGIPKTKILNDDKYFAALNEKLREEVAEYLEAYDTEELADIMEVILAIAAHKGLSARQLEEIRQKKQQERGGFLGRIFLAEVERP